MRLGFLLKLWGETEKQEILRLRLEGPKEGCLSDEEMVSLIEQALSFPGRIGNFPLPQHLKECKLCRAEFRESIAHHRLFEKGKLPQPPEGFANRMVQAILAAKPKPSQ